MAVTNAGDSSDPFIQSGYVTGALAPFWSRPGFAIPLVQSRADSNITYVQQVDSARKVVGFDIFEGEGDVVPLDVSCPVRIGSQEVYAFVDPDGTPHVGTRSKLSPIVMAWVSIIDTPLLRMNFARFCGDRQTAVRSAHEAVKIKKAEFGSEERAIHWFIDAVVSAELVTALAGKDGRQLTNLDRDVHSALVVSSDRARIQIRVTPSAIRRRQGLNRNRRFRLAKILEFAHAVTGREIDVVPIEELRNIGSPSGNLRYRAANISSDVRAKRRQEERLAVLLRATISDTPAARLVIRDYVDSATFARSAVGWLRDALNDSSQGEDPETMIARGLPSLISSAYPLQKGRLLLDFARILGDYPQVADVIRDATSRSNSRYVNSVRKLIFDALN